MKRLAVAGLVMGLMAVAGCTHTDKVEIREEVRGIRQQVDVAADGARTAAANAALEGKVKAVLASRKGLDARGIDVEANAGLIILKGDVASPDQAQLARTVAMEVEGVTSVDNQLMMRIPATQGQPSTDTTVPPAPGPTNTETAPPMTSPTTPGSGY